MPKSLADIYREEDKYPVVKGLNGPVLCIIASMLFLFVTLVGICGAVVYGALHEKQTTQIQAFDE